MKSVLIPLVLIALAAPASASWSDWWNWWTNRDQEQTSTEAPQSPEPTEEEVTALNEEIVQSAAENGVAVDAEAMEAYARSLAMTLHSFTPEQRARILDQ